MQAILNLPSVSKEFTVRNLLDNVQKRIRALQALNQPVGHWDVFLILIIRQKLNNYLREKWEETVGTTELPTFKQLLLFLERRSLIENTQNFQKSRDTTKLPLKSNNNQAKGYMKNTQTCLSTTSDTPAEKPQPSCPVCKNSHYLWSCDKFKELTPQERYDLVKKLSICHNCFNSNHRTRDCRKYTCRKCRKRHHILLHFDSEQSTDPHNSKPEMTCQNITTLFNCKFLYKSQVILATAIVDILDSKGNYRPCRAILDSCSQCNSITERLANVLGLNKKEVNIKLKGVANLESSIKYVTSTEIKSRYEDLKLQFSFFVFTNISESMPSLPINRNTLRIPENIFLADPNFHTPADIDILIGAEHFYTLLRNGQIRIPGQSALLQETELGWVFSGRYANSQSLSTFDKKPSVSCNLINFKELPILWELGEDNNSKHLSAEESSAEDHCIKNVSRDESGRYIVKLPFNDKKKSLGVSKNTAYQRLYALEKHFLKDPDLKAQYVDCLESYFEEDHISLLSNADLNRPGYYLPHQAVVKVDSLTTKTRVVFDGSAKTSSGLSLNDTLLVGPTIQDDLFSIVVRFRSNIVAFTADIKQMYRQVLVSPEDRVYQKILWRKDPSEPIKTYVLKTVTFGTSCAPFLAVRTLHQLANDEQKRFPLAAEILKRDVYVDDFLSGAQTLEEARKLRDELISLLQCGGFSLRKWSSNCLELCRELSNESSSEYLALDPSETVKALGIQWDLFTDSIIYTVNITDTDSPVTKRSILSKCSKLFDPLGLVGPVIVIGKILIQSLWKIQLGWDDLVPTEIQEQWSDCQNQLPLLSKIKFARCLTVADSVEIQLHGFCDASEKAYGACIYVRATDSQKQPSVCSSLLEISRCSN